MSESLPYYQTGTFAVGGRLLTPEQRAVQSDPDRMNAITKGHRACQGCGEALGARYAMDAAVRAADGRVIAANATGCLEVFSTPYPESSWRVPWIHSLFGNAPAVATGVAAALRAKGRNDVRVIGQGGDGGTVDIGFGALSGMFERGDDVLYVCYDNEGYMNTGVQRSAATPPAARTATTEPLGGQAGNSFGQGKNAPLIAMAHEIPYVATATVAELRDLEAKVTRAMEFHGPRYIHVLVPCPARLGLGDRRDDPDRPAGQGERACSPSSRRSTAPSPASRRSAAVCRSSSTCAGQKRYAHLFSGEGRPDIVATLQAARRPQHRALRPARRRRRERQTSDLLEVLATSERGPQ